MFLLILHTLYVCRHGKGPHSGASLPKWSCLGLSWWMGLLPQAWLHPVYSNHHPYPTSWLLKALKTSLDILMGLGCSWISNICWFVSKSLQIWGLTLRIPSWGVGSKEKHFLEFLKKCTTTGLWTLDGSNPKSTLFYISRVSLLKLFIHITIALHGLNCGPGLFSHAHNFVIRSSVAFGFAP